MTSFSNLTLRKSQRRTITAKLNIRITATILASCVIDASVHPEVRLMILFFFLADQELPEGKKNHCTDYSVATKKRLNF